MQYAKVLGNIPADICTKSLNAELMTKHVSVVDIRYNAGIPTLCPEVIGKEEFSAKQPLDAEFS